MKQKYFDRDLSWLSFNERVLIEANNAAVPLFERIKFLAIYSSNLDEFFRVRVAFIKRLMLADKDKLSKKAELRNPKVILDEIHTVVNKQQKLFGKILQKSILPELRANHINVYYDKPYAAAHLAAVEEIFYSRVLSFIQPIILTKEDQNKIFLENKQLYIVSALEKGGADYLGVINIPSNQASRFQQLPRLDGCFHFTFIDDVIKHYANVIFSGFNVKICYSVKLNRDAELFLEDDYSDDFVNKIKKSLNKRNMGMPSRFLYDPGISESLLTELKGRVHLLAKDCIPGGKYHNMFDLFSLPNPIGKKLENPSWPPLPHPEFEKHSSIFDAIDNKDILLSFPYQKYDYILRFFNEAAIDPEVTSIKATLYRVAKDSHVTNALISAARNGKNVMILIEAKARFDEENNLKWAEQMQNAGVKIVFSDGAIKVHSKVALVTRATGEGKDKKYAFLGTGNFNERTANIYTDFALLTADSNLVNELDDVLYYILGRKKKITLKHLLVAQVNMVEIFSQLIDEEIKHALAGKEARITLKLNNLQDKKMIKKLYQAADRNVKIDLIIRGICCLVPRKNIRVTRIVDRFLEHARIYIFHNTGSKKIFIGSADWMDRNLYRRIEVVFPIYDEEARKLIVHNIKLQLSDNIKATRIGANLENIVIKNGQKDVRSQYDFYRYLKRNYVN